MDLVFYYIYQWLTGNTAKNNDFSAGAKLKLLSNFNHLTISLHNLQPARLSL